MLLSSIPWSAPNITSFELVVSVRSLLSGEKSLLGPASLAWIAAEVITIHDYPKDAGPRSHATAARAPKYTSVGIA